MWNIFPLKAIFLYLILDIIFMQIAGDIEATGAAIQIVFLRFSHFFVGRQQWLIEINDCLFLSINQSSLASVYALIGRFLLKSEGECEITRF